MTKGAAGTLALSRPIGRWSDLDEDEVSLTKTEVQIAPQRTRRKSWLLREEEEPQQQLDIVEPINNNHHLEPLTRSAYKQKVALVMDEFFISFDCSEALRDLQSLVDKKMMPEMLKKCVSMVMDKNDREREALSQLFKAMNETILSTDDFVDGFKLLLQSISDLAVDVPNAKRILSQFIVRGMDDGLLPTQFIEIVINEAENDPEDNHFMLLVKEIREIMKKCSNIKTCADQNNASHIWGIGDGRPVGELKEVVDWIIQDYLLFDNINETLVRMKKLQAPHFQHEILKRIVQSAMDRSACARKKLWYLIRGLHKKEIMSSNQVVLGFRHLFDLLSDLKLDTPQAEFILLEAVMFAQNSGIVDRMEFANLIV